MKKKSEFELLLKDLEWIYPVERAYYLKFLNLLDKYGMVAHNDVKIRIAGKEKQVCIEECWTCVLKKVLE